MNKREIKRVVESVIERLRACSLENPIPDVSSEEYAIFEAYVRENEWWALVAGLSFLPPEVLESIIKGHEENWNEYYRERHQSISYYSDPTPYVDQLLKLHETLTERPLFNTWFLCDVLKNPKITSSQAKAVFQWWLEQVQERKEKSQNILKYRISRVFSHPNFIDWEGYVNGWRKCPRGYKFEMEEYALDNPDIPRSLVEFLREKSKYKTIRDKCSALL